MLKISGRAIVMAICAVCRTSTEIRLSCTHSLCLQCLKQLKALINTEGKAQVECPACHGVVYLPSNVRLKFSNSVVRILVVGLTGHGKSALINKLVGKYVAKVEHGATACPLKPYIMKYDYLFNNTIVRIYETWGMGDIRVSGREIFQDIKNEVKEVDLMVICHRLYDRAEEATKSMLKQIISECGKDLLNKSVLCYTRADEYKVNDNPVQAQKDSLTKAIKPILTQHTLTEAEFDAIPICLTSTKDSDLPTAPNWINTFWECCTQRSAGEAAVFLSWFAKVMIGLGLAEVGAGIAGGAAIGGAVGSGIIPVLGTAVGAMIGGIVGTIVGTVGGIVTIATGLVIDELIDDTSDTSD